jgi:hypothetical protein
MPAAKIGGRVCYAFKSVYSSLAAEITGMIAHSHGGIDRATVEGRVADSGVRLTPQEVDAVVRSLARIQIAAAALLQSPLFDQTIEQFYRLLESDAADTADEIGR